MLNIAVFMVVKNDEYYIDMALKSVLSYVKGVYIQDQFSSDGTYEKILSMKSEKIFIERVDTGINERFGKQYNEPKYRTLAVKRAEEIFEPEWILKCDADEIFTEHFFDSMLYLLSYPDFVKGVNGIKVGGERFISITHRSMYPEGIEISPLGIPYPDPHIQLWKANRGYYYICNPMLSGYTHPVLHPSPKPIFWLDGICNIHLGRVFGPKSFSFWVEGGDEFEPKIPFHAPTMAPKWFNSDRNMGTAESVNFRWPEYILEKWRQFGIW